MSNNPSGLVQQPQEVPFERSPDYRIIFANASRLRVAATDLSVTFGYTDALPTPGATINTTSTNVTVDLATIVLTPFHAKLVALSLLGAINAYEAEYGKIDISARAPVGLDKISAAIKEMLDKK